jgi:hypothetical protein
MSNNQATDNGFWLVIVIVFVFAMILQAIGGGGSSSSTASSSPASSGVDRGSFEHRYATERFKQEGYSAAESQQAADAVIKFHNAQQNRNK